MLIKHADALAINAYFSATEVDTRDIQTLDDVFAGINASREVWAEQIARQAELAERFSVDLIAFEGGQHLVVGGNDNLRDLYRLANRDPRMAEQTKWHLDQWRRSGGRHFSVFTSPEQFSESGTFGAKEYLTQPRSEAPKYDGYLNWIDANPRWW